MSVPLTLLGLLEREPSHGYDLKRDYDTYFGRGKPLRYSQVYATLSRLTRDGKALPGPVEQGAGPERRRYAITDAGVAEVEGWLCVPVPPEPDLQSELFAKVVLSLMLDRPAGRYLNLQRAAHLKRMRELTDLKQHGDPLDVLLADHALYRLEADLRWIDHTTARLDLLAQAVHRVKILQTTGLLKSFGQTPALRGATMGVSRGEILAVMGPSGSGKTTLLHCLAGILVPDEGEVWFDGQRLDTLSDDRRSELRRDRFGFVFQTGQLVPELTVEENIALPLLLGGSRRAPAIAEARMWLGQLGLDGLGQRRSGELSGGQAQRVALARGLVTGPEVLFADEPTGSLDSVSGEVVMNLLTAAVREQGTTVVVVTHEARTAAYADREVIVTDGTISTLTGVEP